MNYRSTLALVTGLALAGLAAAPAAAAAAAHWPTPAAGAHPPATAPGQPATYRLLGCVFGPTGRTLPGATLLLQGTNTIATTDAAGYFVLDVPAQAQNILVAGYAGCEDQPITLGAHQTTLNIHLRPSLAKGLNRALRIGEFAPDFDLPTTTGHNFKLSEHRGHPVVLYFYPKDGSPGCTTEACSFRDQYQDFTDLGAEVIGISSDSEVSHQVFTTKNALPFPLLSDEGGQLRKKYAVPRAVLGLLPGRVTYVLDGEGRVRYIFNSLNDATDHVLNAKAMLQDLPR